MLFRDLSPRKDPKGGSASAAFYLGDFPQKVKTITDNVVDKFTSDAATVAAAWRTLALCLVAANITGIVGFLAFGTDVVRHSEIQSIMDTRAPYMHDKDRIEARFKFLEKQDYDLADKLKEIRDEFRTNDMNMSKDLQKLNILYYRDHPKTNGNGDVPPE